jgi:hypothetical protein
MLPTLLLLKILEEQNDNPSPPLPWPTPLKLNANAIILAGIDADGDGDDDEVNDDARNDGTAAGGNSNNSTLITADHMSFLLSALFLFVMSWLLLFLFAVAVALTYLDVVASASALHGGNSSKYI